MRIERGLKIPAHLIENKPDSTTYFFINCFFELGTTRTSFDGGVNSLSIFDIIKYAELVKYADIEEFSEILKALDSHYMECVSKKIEKERKKA